MESSLGFSDSGKVGEFSLVHFGSVENGSRANKDGSGRSDNGATRCHGQEVGENAESILTGGVLDDDFLAIGIDVRIMTNLVAESITEVGSGLVGSDVTERSLAKFVLRMEFAENG